MNFYILKSILAQKKRAGGIPPNPYSLAFGQPVEAARKVLLLRLRRICAVVFRLCLAALFHKELDHSR